MSILLAGVDGCPEGWIVAYAHLNFSDTQFVVLYDFSDVLALNASIIVVDVPIGLPAVSGFCDKGGRAAEFDVRQLLGVRRSTVFSTPSRKAVYAEVGPFDSLKAKLAAHQRACAVAQRTSNPPRRIAIQAFSIFEKIRQVDQLLLSDASLRSRVYESHPELAFRQMNGGHPILQPKKTVEGQLARRGCLMGAGFSPTTVETAPPKGAGTDDQIDALACLFVAQRIHEGKAKSFPAPPLSDEFGLPMAIWA